eukprot:768261-Hanusia_phi.AAC.5
MENSLLAILPPGKGNWLPDVLPGRTDEDEDGDGEEDREETMEATRFKRKKQVRNKGRIGKLAQRRWVEQGRTFFLYAMAKRREDESHRVVQSVIAEETFRAVEGRALSAMFATRIYQIVIVAIV